VTRGRPLPDSAPPIETCVITPEIIERIRARVLPAAGRSRPVTHETAAAPSVPGTAGLPSQEIAGFIDHTLLRPDAALADVQGLCREALQFRFASVCVNPCWVSTCETLVRGSGVAVCAVTAFPFGASVTVVKVAEAERAIADGAREVDMVMNIGALKSGQLPHVADDIEAVTAVCRRRGVLSKIILETALLSDEEKVTACVLAQRCGADYVKTSTGFVAGGATIEDVMLMRQVVGHALGVKASGGIRDRQMVDAFVSAGASRIGTSRGVSIMRGEPGMPA
jgi:deoxyribose-phosphate aldolase